MTPSSYICKIKALRFREPRARELVPLFFFLVLALGACTLPQTDKNDAETKIFTRASAPALTLDSPRINNSPSKGWFWIDGPDDEVADLLIKNLSPDEILAQVFLLGWPSEHAEGTIMSWIGSRNVGGVKVFGWNGNNLETLASTLGTMQDLALSSRAGIPLLSATDQEGGWVRHIKDRTSQTPGNLAIGATSLAHDAYESSYLIAEELAHLGVNMNFAPTVDVYTEAQAHVIGPRSFGSDPQKVALLSLAAFQGLEDARVIATAKHFPGHGNAIGDSHGTMPVIKDSMDTLWNRDLVPYHQLILEGLPVILTGHLAFPLIDPQERPASLSPILNHDLLRNKLGFSGVIITDDLYMGGAWQYGESKGWRLSDVALESLKAGNDMIMLSQTPSLDDGIWKKIRSQWDESESFREEMKASVKRILLLKLKYLKPENRVPLKPKIADLKNKIPAPGANTFFSQLAARAVSWVYGAPLKAADLKNKRILLVGQDSDFMRSAKEFLPQAEQYSFQYSPFYTAEKEVINTVQTLAPKYDYIFFCLMNPNSQAVLEKLEPWKDKLAVLSTLSPVYLKDLSWVPRALAVYGWERASFRFGMAALLGLYPAESKVPLRWFENP